MNSFLSSQEHAMDALKSRGKDLLKGLPQLPRQGFAFPRRPTRQAEAISHESTEARSTSGRVKQENREEEYRLKLQAMHEVHRHLNAEVETLTVQLARLRGQQPGASAPIAVQQHAHERGQLEAELRALRAQLAAQQRDAGRELWEAAQAADAAQQAASAKAAGLHRDLVAAQDEVRRLQQVRSAAEAEAELKAGCAVAAHAELEDSLRQTIAALHEQVQGHGQALEAVRAEHAAAEDAQAAEAVDLRAALEQARQNCQHQAQRLRAAEQALREARSLGQEDASRMSDLASHVSELEGELASGHEAVATLQSKLRASADTSAGLSEELRQARAQLSEVSAAAAGMEEALQSAQAEAEQQRDWAMASKKEAAGLAAELEEQRVAAGRAAADMAAAHHQVQEALREANADVAQLRTQLAEAADTQAAEGAMNESLRQACGGLEAHIVALETDLRAAAEERDALKCAQRSLQEAADGLRARVAQLEHDAAQSAAVWQTERMALEAAAAALRGKLEEARGAAEAQQQVWTDRLHNAEVGRDAELQGMAAQHAIALGQLRAEHGMALQSAAEGREAALRQAATEHEAALRALAAQAKDELATAEKAAAAAREVTLQQAAAEQEKAVQAALAQHTEAVRLLWAQHERAVREAVEKGAAEKDAALQQAAADSEAAQSRLAAKIAAEREAAVQQVIAAKHTELREFTAASQAALRKLAADCDATREVALAQAAAKSAAALQRQATEATAANQAALERAAADKAGALRQLAAEAAEARDAALQQAAAERDTALREQAAQAEAARDAAVEAAAAAKAQADAACETAVAGTLAAERRARALQSDVANLQQQRENLMDQLANAQSVASALRRQLDLAKSQRQPAAAESAGPRHILKAQSTHAGTEGKLEDGGVLARRVRELEEDCCERDARAAELAEALENEKACVASALEQVAALQAAVDWEKSHAAVAQHRAEELAALLEAQRLQLPASASQALEAVVAGEDCALERHGRDNGADACPSGAEDAAPWLHDARWGSLRSQGRSAGWLIDPAHVLLGRVLGEGAFGTTYLGTWRGADVAVKCVRLGRDSEATSFLREVATLAALRHPNILPFYGAHPVAAKLACACLQPPERCWLVCEYLPGGTLSQWLHGQRLQGGRGAPRRNLAEKVAAALGVAQGMQALEEATPPILHRDLKPSNVLLDAGGAPRVADMGLARQLTPEAAADLTGETGTYIYMAPEMMRHEAYDQRADVYSWGVLLAEVLQQRQPYEGLYLTPVQVALAVGADELRPTLPPDTPERLVALAAACYEPNPEHRPSFGLITHHLRQVLAQVTTAEAQPHGMFGRLWKTPPPAGGHAEVSVGAARPITGVH